MTGRPVPPEAGNAPGGTHPHYPPSGTYPQYPVNLVLAGRPVLVVGAGTVAARKVDELLLCGAAVTVVAPRVDDELAERADLGEIRLERRAYRPGEASAYRLVVTATDVREVNQAVHDDAEAAGVWVNAADDPQRCTFTLPARHRSGTILVSVSTGGRSPGLASWLRRRLAAVVGPEFATLAERVAAERDRVHAEGRSTEGLDWDRFIETELAVLDGTAAASARATTAGGPSGTEETP